MKEVTIGGVVYHQCETIEDMTIKRFKSLKEYLVKSQFGMDIADVKNMFQGFIEGFDRESKSQMLISLYNFVNGLTAIEDGVDYNEMIYTVMTYGKEEDRGGFDETVAKKKLEVWNAGGLDPKTVKDTVEGFVKASPELWKYFFQTNLETQEETTI
jgi:hypothetical protein